jgi:hypothetical protein
MSHPMSDVSTDRVEARPHIYYFGCIGESGHYLWVSDMRKSLDSIGPWGWEIDGGLAPAGHGRELVAAIHHLNGWTAVSFWDRSVDTRSGSNSTFLVHANLGFDEIVRLARQDFPGVFKRLSGPVVSEIIRRKADAGGKE